MMMQWQMEPSWLFYIYSGCSIAGAVMMKGMMIETKGLTDRDKQRVFNSEFDTANLSPPREEKDYLDREEEE